MSTTIELPEDIATLAQQGAEKHALDLPAFLAEAIEEKAAQEPPTHYRGVLLTPERRRQLAIAKKILREHAAVFDALAK
ncbi:hypothetical protein AXK11_07985 [Cephaloticoccus primus]|uniref:CopG family transcriptional regulator n=1 Tax=Cephaloticoccus primus TaxID=1548207 RepID=A0A139SJI7_9BACT|nr:hypothetical protein [Cephaloticoccus primus]KXU34660.1 hypothetical protein AXK11_07985 [Cephaloticoccus primus]